MTDENGSSVTNAPVQVWYAGPDEFRPFLVYTARTIRTFTGGDGRYDVSFEIGSPRFLGNNNVVGMIGARNDVQLLAAATADIVKNLRYHHVPTIDPGHSIVVSIEPDSARSIPFPFLLGDHFGTSNPLDLSRVGETFRIAVGASGTLTVGATGFGATLREFCWSGPEDCGFSRFTQSSPGSISGQVQAGTIYEITVSIPSALAPQRYTVSTSLTQ